MTKPPNPELVKAIKGAVLELILEEGGKAVKLRTIADMVGVTPTTIYYYLAERYWEARGKSMLPKILNLYKEMKNNCKDISVHAFGNFVKIFTNPNIGKPGKMIPIFKKMLSESPKDQYLRKTLEFWEGKRAA